MQSKELSVFVLLLHLLLLLLLPLLQRFPVQLRRPLLRELLLLYSVRVAAGDEALSSTYVALDRERERERGNEERHTARVTNVLMLVLQIKRFLSALFLTLERRKAHEIDIDNASWFGRCNVR